METRNFFQVEKKTVNLKKNNKRTINLRIDVIRCSALGNIIAKDADDFGTNRKRMRSSVP